MVKRRRGLFNTRQGLFLAFVVAVAVHFLLQYGAFGEALNELNVLGSDDAMRLVSLRDLIAGQGWFDMTQHRVLPPEGLSMHWSRLVDAMLMAIIAALRPFTGFAEAQIILTWLWPGLLFVLYLWIIVVAGRAGFSRSAASLAVLVAAILPMVNGSYFPFGRLDHHSLQVLCIALVVALLMDPSGNARRGVAIGAVAALSLAIGLEALVPMALAGVVLVAEFIFDRPFAAARLSGFAAGVLGLTPMLFLVSQPPAEWGLIECDQLSLPYLVLVLVTSSAILFALALRAAVQSVRSRSLLFLALAVVAGVALWPMAQACAGGPFSAVPEVVQREVMAIVTENTSAAQLFTSDPALAVAILVPHLVVTLICLILLYRAAPEDRRSYAILSTFLLLGVVGAAYQFRALAWGGAVQALAIGVILAWLSRRPRILISLPASVLLLVVVLSPGTLARPFLSQPGAQAAEAAPRFSQSDWACKTGSVLSPLNGLPRGRVLSPLNLGTPILLHTHHAVLSAPYHRNGAAMLNGVVPFREPEEAARDVVGRYGADYVALCNDPVPHLPQDAFRRRLMSGDAPDWLEPVQEFGGPLLVFRVVAERI